MFENGVYAKDMKVGVVYGSTPVGEFQIDSDGRYWWKRVDGSVQEVRPTPKSLFYVKGYTRSEQGVLRQIETMTRFN
jgi:hypothetical protein